MEVAWEDRGRIAHNGFYNGRFCDYNESPVKEWWNAVFDACMSAEKKMVPGGTEILIVKDEVQNG